MMMQAKDEAETIMAALAGGERRALGRLIALYGPGLRRYIAGALHQSADAEDVAQELFIRVWSRASQYDPSKGAVSTWLYRLAVNLCIDHNRRGRFRRFVGLETEQDAPDLSPAAEVQLAAKEQLAKAEAAIAQLPDRQRRAILLKSVGGLTSAEIADALSMSEGAVEQLLVRARARLRAVLEPKEIG